MAIAVSSIVVGVSLSISRPLAVESIAIAQTMSIVAQSMAIVSTIVVGVSLSISRPLAVEAIAIAQTMSIVAQTVAVAVSSVVVWISLSHGHSGHAGENNEFHHVELFLPH